MEDWYKSLGVSLTTLLIGCVLTLILSTVLRTVFSKITSRTKSQTDDYFLEIISKAIKPLGFLISISISIKLVQLQDDIDNLLLGITKLLILIVLVRLSNKLLIRLIHRWANRIDDSAVSTMLNSMGPMVRSLIWSIGFVFYLQNMGVQMAALWALLSAGGIGAGLALKEPVQEFFEYITILLDKPFQNGQFIHAEGIWATVERVGVRSTRLRSLNGEIIVMSNSSLTNGIISNYAEMKHRRIVHKLGVVYNTTVEKMKLIPSLVEAIISNTIDAKFDRCHFVEFGSSSLDFELVYYISTNNYKRAMEAQQKINLEIMEEFEKHEIEFAFPTTTINLNKD